MTALELILDQQNRDIDTLPDMFEGLSERDFIEREQLEVTNEQPAEWERLGLQK